jgi:hypothetical protein
MLGIMNSVRAEHAADRFTATDLVTAADLAGVLSDGEEATLMRGAGSLPTRCEGNGPEFADKMLDQWAYHNGVEIDFSRPGKPRTMRFAKPSTVASGRMPERLMVTVDGRRHRTDRGMEPLQQRQTPQLAW